MNINFIDAPAGAGKTNFICNEILKRVKLGEEILLVQPNKELIDETYKKLTEELKLPSHQIERIYGDKKSNLKYKNSINKNVASRIIAAFKVKTFGGRVVIITRSGFDNVGFFPAPNRWSVIFDECPEVCLFHSLDIPYSHKLIINYISVSKNVPYAKVSFNNKITKNKLLDFIKSDKLYQEMHDVIRIILHDGWESFVDLDSFKQFISGDSKTKKLKIYSKRNTNIISKFKTCTIASARFKESFFYIIMSSEGHKFHEYPVENGSIRYHKHENGNNLEIHYMEFDRWSKNKAEQNPGILDELKKYIISIAAGRKFIFLGNKGVSHPDLVDAGGIELSGYPFGLNKYQHIDVAAIFPAYNPDPGYAKFLKYHGVGPYELDIGMHNHSVYQAGMRCSLRDPDSTRRVIIVVPDKRTAEWLHYRVFPGSVLKPIPISTSGNIGNVGRPSIYESNAEKQKAYRQRKKAAASSKGDHQSPADYIDLLDTFGVTKPFIYNNFVTHDENKDEVIFKMNLYESITSVGAYDVIDMKGWNCFVELMREFSGRLIKLKSDDKLFNFTEFSNSRLTRREVDAYGAHVIILDNDGGGVSYDDFRNIFPEYKMVILNTFSSTVNLKRWRALIPLSKIVSVSEYGRLYDFIFHRLEKAGYSIPKADPSKPYQDAHGFDMSKRSVVSIFYLPCRAEDPKGSFFEAVEDGDRRILNPDEWLGAAIPRVPAPPLVPSLPATGDSPSYPQAVSNSVLEKAIERWRTVGSRPGNGNQEFMRLAVAAQKLGLPNAEIRGLLHREAAYAHTPEDRRKQIESLIQWMDRKLAR